MHYIFKQSELFKRIVSALIMLGIGGYVLFIGGGVFIFFLWLLTLLMAYETQCLIREKHYSSVFLAYALGSIIAISTVIFFYDEIVLGIGIVFIVWLGFVLYKWKQKKLWFEFLSLLLISAFLSSFIVIRLDTENGFYKSVFLFFIVMGMDVFAYFGGKLWGRKKLAPHISPGKTWNGLFVGIVGANLLSIPFGLYFNVIDLGFMTIIFITVMAILAQMFDLLESGLKRYANKKDSGHIIPGHGGILDRLDGVMGVFIIAGILQITNVLSLYLWN